MSLRSLLSNWMHPYRGSFTFECIVLFFIVLTLWDRRGRVRAVRQLIGLKTRHRRGWETTRYQVIKRHELIGSCLLPPASSSITKPNLQDRKQWTITIYSHKHICRLFLTQNSAKFKTWHISAGLPTTPPFIQESDIEPCYSCKNVFVCVMYLSVQRALLCVQ